MEYDIEFSLHKAIRKEKNAGSAGKGRGMGKGEIWGRLALALAALEHQPVCDHGDELGVGGLALGVADGEAEVFL